ncbi:MAG: cache domain-containing protein [Rhizobacter sp.]|jgi:signal transduction histidine kinase
MKNTWMVCAFAATVTLSSQSALAAAQGSAAEAKSMLQKAVAAIKADKARALAQMSRGDAGFRDRDLYPFCGGADGTFTAHPTLTGKSMKDLKGADGEPVGTRLYDSAKEGEITEVEYAWPKPGAKEPSPKISFVTKVGDQVCAVGYYK